MAKHEYGARKQAILAIIKARPGISSTDVRTTYDAQTGKDSGKSTVSSSLTELHGAGDVRREKVLSETRGYFYRYWLTELVCGFPVEAAAPVQAGTPVHMKPFNMEHARAGAPFCCRDGEPATVLKWDGRGDYSLIGMFGANDLAASWTDVGCFSIHDQDAIDLVMLPLGFIDGKPVWVGDELADVEDSTRRYTVEPHQNNFDGCRWPAPAPVYPTFDGSVDMLAIEYRKDNNYRASLIRIANFALRHAIDAGQVVLPNGDGMSAELVRAQEAAAKTGEMLQRDAARDQDVAQAVRDAIVKAMKPYGPSVAMVARKVDLSAIIAGVAK